MLEQCVCVCVRVCVSYQDWKRTVHFMYIVFLQIDQVLVLP